MRHLMSVPRPLLVVAVTAAAALLPSATHGQLAVQPANIRVLVLPPYPANPADSTFAIQIGDAIRKRVDAKLRLKVQVVTKEKMGEALASSGFAPDAILDDNGATQLARFMNVDAYFWATMERNSETPTVKLRLVDNRRSGLSGWITVKGVPGEDTDRFAAMVTDSIDIQVKAAEQARECLDRRDRKDYGSAKERADRAFRLSPNHPQAALCAALVHELTKAPLDSQLAAYKRAAVGDPLLTRAWDGIAGIYRQKGDSLGWANALMENLKSNPTDMRMRLAAVELLWRGKQYATSVELLDEGLQRSPGDVGATQLKARSCFDGGMWACAVQLDGERFEADTAVQNDSLYILRIIAAASAANDSATVNAAPASVRQYFRLAPDFAAIEKWAGVAVRKFPNSVAFWRRLAGALKTNGKNDEALAAFRRVAQLDPNDFASRVQIAQILTDRASALVDSLVKVQEVLKRDTIQLKAVKPTWDPIVGARFAPADTVLGEAARLATEDTKVNVAVLYYQPATRLVQAQIRPDLASQWLERAIALDSKRVIANQASFFLGLAYVYTLPSLDIASIQKNKDCRGVSNIAELVNHAKSAMMAGASVQPQTADQVIKSLAPYENFVPQARKAWNCK